MGSLRTPGACFIGSTNPDRNDNFIKTDFIDRRDKLNMKYWTFNLDDNPVNTDEYKRDINLEYTGVLHDRFIKGLWVATQGLIYPFYANAPDTYFIDVDKYLKETGKRIKYLSIGVDWGPNGTGNAAVAHGITNNYEDVIVLDEFILDDTKLSPAMLEDELCNFIKRVTFKYGGAYVYCDNAIGTLTNGLHYAAAKSGIKAEVYNCFKRPIMDRIVLNNKLMAQGRFKIAAHCVNIKKALCNAVWTNENKKDERAKDKLNNSHIIDALEYAQCVEHDNIEKAGHILNADKPDIRKYSSA